MFNRFVAGLQVERHVRAHGASALAACATLLLALLLVHRGNEHAGSGSPIGSSQVILLLSIITIVETLRRHWLQRLKCRLQLVPAPLLSHTVISSVKLSSSDFIDCLV